MAIPGQRKPGQTGGRYGHHSNTRASRARGGSPGASRGGGGGGGKKTECPFAPKVMLILALIFGGIGAFVKHVML